MGRPIKLALLALMAGYIAINLYISTFVTTIRHVSFTIRTTDESGNAIPGASVRTLWRRPDDRSDRGIRELGSTNSSGVVEGEVVVQAQPVWTFPPVGRISTPALVLEVSAPGFEVKRVRAF